MLIRALRKTTLLDYPAKVAATVFVGGCNFHCGFCQNPDLIKKEGKNAMAEEFFFKFLAERKGLIDGVCLTGGEPTLQTDIIRFIKKIKQEGFLVKLDTNGSRPDVLKKLIGEVDYIAMDIKCQPEKYSQICGADFPEESVALVKQAKDYEFRTTVVPGIIDEKEIEKIGQLLEGSKVYYLQQFRNEKTLDQKWQKVQPYSDEKLKELANLVRPYFGKVEIRGL